jgi:hypothetical protein
VSEPRLVELSMGLRGAAPDLWDAFVQEMHAHADAVAQAMVNAPLEMLARAQGMAMEARDTAKLLAEAPKTFDKMQAARMRERHV